MTTKVETRLAGTKQQYYVLKVYKNGEIFTVHTSSSLNYIQQIRKRYNG